MTLQNRVLPTGEIVALAARGTLTGNRGILHDAGKRLGPARWRHQKWVCCELEFRGRWREVMRAGGYYTELFFLDEAVALAAGHRPCAQCRHADHLAFRAAWGRAFGTEPTAAEMDRGLHRARVGRNRLQVTYEDQLSTLPDGCFILHDGSPHLALGRALLPFAPEGYGVPVPRPSAAVVTVLTPRPTVAVLVAGYPARLHGSVAAFAGV